LEKPFLGGNMHNPDAGEVLKMFGIAFTVVVIVLALVVTFMTRKDRRTASDRTESTEET
jgi:hypothetical protein